MRRARERVKVGGRAKALLNNKTDLLYDMGLVGPNKFPLRECWMYGVVTEIKGSKIELDLPAAEEKVWFAKEHVFAIKNETEPNKLYVAYDNGTVKTVTGLELPGGFFPADYFGEKKDAQQAIKNALEQTKNVPLEKACAEPNVAKHTESLQSACNNTIPITKTSARIQVRKLFFDFEHIQTCSLLWPIVQAVTAISEDTNVQTACVTGKGRFCMAIYTCITYKTDPNTSFEKLYRR